MANTRPAKLCGIGRIGAGIMNATLTDHSTDYLRLRRLLGATLTAHDGFIRQFLTWLKDSGQEKITGEAAVRWAGLPVDTASQSRAFRLSVIRGFSAYVHAQDPSLADIILPGLIPSKVAHAVPYIYTPKQTQELMAAARTLSPPLRGLTLSTVIGLMATTGMRIGETLALNVSDIDLGAGTILVTGKYGKKRLVPVLPSTVRALRDYLRQSRKLVSKWDTAAFFLTFIGTRAHRGSAEKAFRSLTTALGLTARPGTAAPRLHDFRHAFATTTLIEAYRHSGDVDACIAVLATYLGHVSPASTYWYLSATPELLTLASEKVEAAHNLRSPRS